MEHAVTAGHVSLRLSPTTASWNQCILNPCATHISVEFPSFSQRIQRPGMAHPCRPASMKLQEDVLSVNENWQQRIWDTSAYPCDMSEYIHSIFSLKKLTITCVYRHGLFLFMPAGCKGLVPPDQTEGSSFLSPEYCHTFIPSL